MNAALPFPIQAPAQRKSAAAPSRAAIKADLLGVAPLPGEAAADLAALRAALAADLRPASTIEALQVERLASVAWRLARVERWERREQNKVAVRERRVEWREGRGLAPTESVL